MTARIYCAVCGEELWGAGDAIGLCSWCRETDDEPRDLEDELDAVLAEADEEDRTAESNGTIRTEKTK